MESRNVIKTYEAFTILEGIERQGWIDKNVPEKRRESDVDHTYQTMILASIFVHELNLENVIDYPRLLEMLLIHEAGEIIVGDKTIVDEKYDEYQVLEQKAAITIFNNLSPKTRDHYIGLINEFNERKTPTAQLAYQIDKLDPVIKATIYERKYSMGGELKEFWEHQKEKGTFDGTVFEEFFEELEKDFSKGKTP